MLTTHRTLGDRAAKNKLASSVGVTVGPVALWAVGRQDQHRSSVGGGWVVQGRGGNTHNDA